MPKYWFKGRATLSGVEFCIEASSKEEAKVRAKNGEWDDYDTSGADTADWEINANAFCGEEE
jgi:hypothetical protein